tara:strand:- start:462 stop:629 length:168 start_codon:yes stop_codon:yes gene_type:complete
MASLFPFVRSSEEEEERRRRRYCGLAQKREKRDDIIGPPLVAVVLSLYMRDQTDF